MIGLIVTLAIIGAALVGGTVLCAMALMASGKIGLRGSPQREVQTAKARAMIAEYDQRRATAAADAARSRRMAAQEELNRQVMEARGQAELQKLHDEQFQRELEQPLETVKVS